MAISTVKATINGIEYTLTYNGTSGKYEATVTAPTITSYNLAGGYYGVDVVATDIAGNTTTKTSTEVSNRLVVKEKVPPVISNLVPSASARLTTANPTITGKILDEVNGSGVNTSTFVLQIDGVAKTGTTFSPVAGGFTFSYAATGLAQGTHTYTVDCKDNDGNSAVQQSVNFTVDTIAPTLNVSSPTNALLTNTAALTVIGVTSDTTSNPTTVTIKLNGVTQSAVVVDGGGNFSKAITLANGTNTIEITATDGAGLATTITRTVTLDTIAPTITLIELVPNPVDAGATFIIKVTASDS